MKLCSRCCILGWPLAAAPSSTSSQRKLIVLHTKSRLGLRLRSREAPFCNPDLNFFFQARFLSIMVCSSWEATVLENSGKNGILQKFGKIFKRCGRSSSINIAKTYATIHCIYFFQVGQGKKPDDTQRKFAVLLTSIKLRLNTQNAR